jgi:hypothetical protein
MLCKVSPAIAYLAYRKFLMPAFDAPDKPSSCEQHPILSIFDTADNREFFALQIDRRRKGLLLRFVQLIEQPSIDTTATTSPKR